MARTIQELAGVRDGIRRQWLLPVPPPFPGDAELEDTSEETLALLAKQRAFSPALLRALRTGNPDAINEARPRPPRGVPRGTGRLEALAGEFVGGASTDTQSWGPINFPYTIREVVLTASNDAAAGTQGRVEISLHLTGEDVSGDGVARTEPRIWPELKTSLVGFSQMQVIGQQSNTARYPAATLVTDTGQFLTLAARHVPALNIRSSVLVAIEEVDLGAWSLADLIPLGRQSISPAARRTPTRLPRPTTPRGAIVRVTQGGRILAERRIPWEALDASLRAKWFAQQIGEDPDPSVTWIQ